MVLSAFFLSSVSQATSLLLFPFLLLIAASSVTPVSVCPSLEMPAAFGRLGGRSRALDQGSELVWQVHTLDLLLFTFKRVYFNGRPADLAPLLPGIFADLELLSR